MLETVSKTSNGENLRRDTNLFQNGSSSNHALGISEAKVVRASLNWRNTGCRNSSRQGSDVDGLSLSDGHQTGESARVEAQSSELIRREFGETLLVEGRLQVLESESTVDG